MRTRNNIIANFVGQGWSAAMNLAFVPVYVAKLGIENYALIGVFAALQAWLALLDLGMSPTLTREMARFTGGAVTPTAIRDLLRSVELVCAGIGLIAIAGLWAGSQFIATRWLHTSLPAAAVADALGIMGVVIALRFMEALYRSALYGLERQVWFNAINVTVTTARFGGAAIVVAFIKPTIDAFFLWQLAVSTISVAILRLKLAHVLPPGDRRARFSVAALHEIKQFAIGMIGINLTALVLTQADKVVLSRMLPLGEFGYYTLAFTMCSVIVAVAGPIVQASYPSLVREHAVGDDAAFAATYHRAAQLVAVAAGSVAVVLAVFAPRVIGVWTGDSTLVAAAAPLLSLLAAGTLLNALMQIPYFGLLAIGETNFPLRANAIAAALLIAMLLWSVPHFRAAGAAGSWLAINLTFVLIGLPLLHRNHLQGLLRDWWLRDTGPVLLAVAVICAVVAFGGSYLSGDRLVGLTLLVVAGATALAAAVLASPLARTALLGMISGLHARRPWRGTGL